MDTPHLSTDSEMNGAPIENIDKITSDASTTQGLAGSMFKDSNDAEKLLMSDKISNSATKDDRNNKDIKLDSETEVVIADHTKDVNIANSDQQSIVKVAQEAEDIADNNVKLHFGNKASDTTETKEELELVSRNTKTNEDENNIKEIAKSKDEQLSPSTKVDNKLRKPQDDDKKQTFHDEDKEAISKEMEKQEGEKKNEKPKRYSKEFLWKKFQQFFDERKDSFTKNAIEKQLEDDIHDINERESKLRNDLNREFKNDNM